MTKNINEVTEAQRLAAERAMAYDLATYKINQIARETDPAARTGLARAVTEVAKLSINEEDGGAVEALKKELAARACNWLKSQTGDQFDQDFYEAFAREIIS